MSYRTSGGHFLSDIEDWDVLKIKPVPCKMNIMDLTNVCVTMSLRLK